MSETANWRRTEDYLKFGMIVQRYIGKPYSGNSRFQPGIDCSLFTQEVMREYADVTLPRTAADQYRQGTEVPRRSLLYGDLLFFTTEREQINHVGLYIGFNEFIHASTSQGVIVSALNESYWAKRFVGARRILK
jgi:cell wall-associated NlpC family hydrolase